MLLRRVTDVLRLLPFPPVLPLPCHQLCDLMKCHHHPGDMERGRTVLSIEKERGIGTETETGLGITMHITENGMTEERMRREEMKELATERKDSTEMVDIGNEKRNEKA